MNLFEIITITTPNHVRDDGSSEYVDDSKKHPEAYKEIMDETQKYL